MNTRSKRNDFLRHFIVALARAWLVAGLLLCTKSVLAQPGPGEPPNYLDSWSFQLTKGWPSDQGYAPVSFANLAFSNLGNGCSLVVDTNVPAWLQYQVVENGGATNLSVAEGSVTFWYAPGSWSSTNGGPGQCAQLIDVGELTTNAASGYWGLLVDAAGQNLWFISQDGAGNNYSLSTPISWTTDYFHFIALTYSPTNVSLYLDGQLATNDPGGLSVLPGSAVLANGFFIGSDTNGLYQAQGLFNSIFTYDAALDSDTIQSTHESEIWNYAINPFNVAMNFSLAPFSPSTNGSANGFEVISGSGNLEWLGSIGGCVNSPNVWIANPSYASTGTNTGTLTFTIMGGTNGYAYDVFATTALVSPITNANWTWMGQGNPCNIYALPNLPKGAVLLILGTPKDYSGQGLTDAYELLVAKINPEGTQTDAYGVPYAWYVQNSLSLQSATQDPDMDGLRNYQEYFYGTRPTVSEGTTIWVGTPNGNTGIP